MSTTRKVTALLTLGLLAGSATAAVVTFDDKTAFTTQTGSSLGTLPNANATTSITISGRLTITRGDTSGPLYSGTGVATYFNIRPNFMAKGGVENFDFAPLTSTYAFGFSLYEPGSSTATLNGCNTTCVDSTFVASLYSGATSLGSWEIKPTDSTFSFYGFWSSDPITSITIRETLGSNDNEFFGEFYTGTTASPVPLPAAAWLLLSGLGALGFTGRRHKAA